MTMIYRPITIILAILLCTWVHSQDLGPQWSTYMGGAGEDWGRAVAVASDGTILLAGRTASTTDMALNGHQMVHGGGDHDAYMAWSTAEGELIRATYFGGTSEDNGHAVAVMADGGAVLVGGTDSPDGIAFNGHQMMHGGASDGFIARFDAEGTLIWSTYIGGSDIDVITGVAISEEGEVYITGYTRSDDGIAPTDAWQGVRGGGYDGFFAKYDAGGTLQWSSYYGGSDDEFFEGIALGANGSFLLCGSTHSVSGMVFNGHQVGHGGSRDAFLAQFNSLGVREWSTYYGGPGYDQGFACALSSSGEAYLAGVSSSSTNISDGGHQLMPGGGMDGFLVKFSATGVRQWGTYYGGSAYDEVRAVVVGPDGMINMVGQTGSATGIATSEAFQPVPAGGSEGFVARFHPDGGRSWASYLGGNAGDGAFGIGMHATGWFAVSGNTQSTSGLATPGAHQENFGGGGDGFLFRVGSGIGTGIFPKEDASILYYDPLRKEVHVQHAPAAITVYDVKGRVVLRKGPASVFSTAGLAPGVYMVRIGHEVRATRILVP